MTRRFLLLAGGAVLVAVAALLVSTHHAGGARDGYIDGTNLAAGTPSSGVELLGTLPAALHEASGVAVSRRHIGVLWTHNDSGDEPLLYGVDLRGTPVALYQVRNADANDWEDIALGPCLETRADVDCLYIADIGDNQLERDEYAIVVVAEPDPPAVSGRGSIRGRTIRFRYLGGRYDAEALAVTPQGTVLVITKQHGGTARLFQLSQQRLAHASREGGPVTAELMASVPIDGRGPLDVVTGAAVSPDGHTLAVRTYAALYLWHMEDGAIGELHARCSLGAIEPQGEAVDFFDANALILVSEASRSRAGTIHRVRCPATR